MSDQKMELDLETLSQGTNIVQEDDKSNIIAKLLALKPRYLGVYAPGDFNVETYRLIMPDSQSPKRGRGYYGVREKIILETLDRAEIDKHIGEIQGLAKVPGGPVAVRHIVNHESGRDEGLRIVWPNRDGLVDDGEAEMADWPRRDQLIKEGKAVMPDLGTFLWAGEAIYPPVMGMSLGVGAGMGCGFPMAMAMPYGQLPSLTTGHLSGYSTPMMSPLTPMSPVGGYDPYPAMQVDQTSWCVPEGYLASAE